MIPVQLFFVRLLTGNRYQEPAAEPGVRFRAVRQHQERGTRAARDGRRERRLVQSQGNVTRDVTARHYMHDPCVCNLQNVIMLRPYHAD